MYAELYKCRKAKTQQAKAIKMQILNQGSETIPNIEKDERSNGENEDAKGTCRGWHGNRSNIDRGTTSEKKDTKVVSSMPIRSVNTYELEQSNIDFALQKLRLYRSREL